MIARPLAALAVLGFAALAPAPRASAHAFLAGASPPVGGELPSPPTELTLRFSEKVEPAFCTVQLRDAAGGTVRTGAPAPAANGQGLVVTLPKLPPGTYTVIWRVTSVDTHATEGRFQFSVGR